MSLIIVTKSSKLDPFSLETYKRLLRTLTKRNRGPSSVTTSLMRGLDELSYDYKLNPTREEIGTADTVWVNESIDALYYAITNREKYRHLIVGPNLVVTTSESESIITDTRIDTILQPSEWTKDFMTSQESTLENKVQIWPAGVSIPESNTQKKTSDVLLFIKNDVEDSLLEKIQTLLQKENLSFTILHYGTFKQSDYFSMLNKTKFLIYLSNSESQGLALQEAWVRDVPTLVFNRGYFEYKEYTFKNDKISAPYLTKQTGMFFNSNNFEEVFYDFINDLKKFTPKQYVIDNLSDKVCAQKFLQIISEHTK